MSPERGHPDWNDLAALAEGRAGDRSGELEQHLAGCRRCLAAYAEAVRLRTRELVAADSLAVPPAFRRAAAGAGPAAVSQGRPWRRRGLGAALAVIAGLVLIVVVRPGPLADPPDVDAVREALLAQAPAGMVLPDLMPAAGSEPAVYRGPDGGPGDLAAELAALGRRYARDPGAENAFWFGAGQLAAGQLQAASDLLREARRRHPDAMALQLLDAMASYRRSELARAETLLREVLVRRPDHPEARFNLALVLQETGRPAEARELVAGTAWREGTWLAGRAAALRDTLR